LSGQKRSKLYLPTHAGEIDRTQLTRKATRPQNFKGDQETVIIVLENIGLRVCGFGEQVRLFII
jgi:hypothetical protein